MQTRQQRWFCWEITAYRAIIVYEKKKHKEDCKVGGFFGKEPKGLAAVSVTWER